MSLDGKRAKLSHKYRGRSTSVSFSAVEDEKINASYAYANNILPYPKSMKKLNFFEPNRGWLESLPATKNHQGGIGDSEDQSHAKIFCL